jgi:hypothetical protein
MTVDGDTAFAWGWDVAAADLVDSRTDWPEHDVLSLGTILASLANQLTD